jgi:hypothetical protein
MTLIQQAKKQNKEKPTRISNHNIKEKGRMNIQFNGMTAINLRMPPLAA